MDFQSFISNVLKRKGLLVFLAVGLILFIAYMITGLTPMITLFKRYELLYLSLIENIADSLLHFAGSTIVIQNHQVYFDGEIVFRHEWIAYKKWFLALLVFFWITPAPIRKKLIYTVLIILVNFVGSVSDVTLVSYFVTEVPDVYSANLMGLTLHFLLLLTLLTTWIWRERKTFLRSISWKRNNLMFLEDKLPAIFIVVFFYTLLSKFFLGCFQYTHWINVLFSASSWILERFHYSAVVDTPYLVGENATLYMFKPCLGLNTIALFASIVYITGSNNLTKWVFIICGVIFLNFVNIIRFVLLFIHIQKHAGYALTMDLHDMYNYVIYTLVFILWIFWFERYSDIGEKKITD